MRRILIIDDDASVRRVLRRCLEGAGYEVVEAVDGQEGIKRHRERRADLIITDMIMPKKEGMETILDIRREFPDTKIIAISGGDRIGPGPYLQVARGFGAERVLTKPFPLEELLAEIGRLLG